VVYLLGSKSVDPLEERQYTHDTSLAVSTIMVWITTGEPMPTVITYCSVPRADPKVVGTVRTDGSVPFFPAENFRWT
jgi:hypothetical protein